MNDFCRILIHRSYDRSYLHEVGPGACDIGIIIVLLYIRWLRLQEFAASFERESSGRNSSHRLDSFDYATDNYRCLIARDYTLTGRQQRIDIHVNYKRRFSKCMDISSKKAKNSRETSRYVHYLGSNQLTLLSCMNLGWLDQRFCGNSQAFMKFPYHFQRKRTLMI